MRFDRDRLIFIALLVLDEVCYECAKRPVKPTFAIRLALATLYALGDGERRIFEDFWNEMRRETYPGANPTQCVYRRATGTRTSFTGIARSVGISLSIEYVCRMQKARGHRPRHMWKQTAWIYGNQPDPKNTPPS